MISSTTSLSSASFGKKPPVDTKGTSQKQALQEQFLATEPEMDSGEPQTLESTINLRIDVDEQTTASGHGNNHSDPTQVQFEGDGGLDPFSHSGDVSNFYFDDNPSASHDEDLASSSSEEPGPAPAPAPAPIPAATPAPVQPTPVQPAPQFSNDPAIAALQKSQHENTKNIVLYTELLQILNQALIDTPTLPKNSFDFVKGIFNQSLQQCTARVEQLSNQTQLALDEHAEQARSLAAQANGGNVATGGNGTFSTTPPQRLTHAQVNQLRTEVGRIDDPQQQQTVVAGLQTALQDMGMVTDEQLDQLLLDMGGETEGTRRQQADDVAALDKALEQLADVQEAMEESVDWDQHVCEPDKADMEAIKKQVEAEENEKLAAYLAEKADERNANVDELIRQFEENEKEHLGTETQEAQGGQEPPLGQPSQEFFNELDDLLENAERSAEQSATAESTFAHIDFNNPFEGMEAVTAEFNDKYPQQKQVPSQGGAQQPSPTPQAKSPTSLSSGTGNKTNSAQVSLEERWKISRAGDRLWNAEHAELLRQLRDEEERSLTPMESRRRKDLVAHGGKEKTSHQEILNLRKKKIIQAFQKEQENKIASIHNETIRIDERLEMADASEYERQYRLIQLATEEKNRKLLKQAGDSYMKAL